MKKFVLLCFANLIDILYFLDYLYGDENSLDVNPKNPDDYGPRLLPVQYTADELKTSMLSSMIDNWYSKPGKWRRMTTNHAKLEAVFWILFQLPSKSYPFNNVYLSVYHHLLCRVSSKIIIERRSFYCMYTIFSNSPFIVDTFFCEMLMLFEE